MVKELKKGILGIRLKDQVFDNNHMNYRNYIDAFANVPSHLECQLWLAGSSDNRYTPRLKEQIQELGLTNQVKFLDYVPYDDLPKIISGAIALFGCTGMCIISRTI